MKKLLVLAVSALLVFGMSAFAMADPAVTLHGEIDGVADMTHSTSTAGGQFTIDAAVNPNVSFESEFTWGGFNKGYNATGVNPEVGTDLAATAMGPTDHYFVNVKGAYGSLKTGWTDNWTGQKLDQIGSQIYNEGKRHGANFIYTTPVFDKVSASLGYEPQTRDAAVLVDYTADKYGVEFAYSKPGDAKAGTIGDNGDMNITSTQVNGLTNTDASYGVNAYYNIMNGAVVYGQYAIKSAKTTLNPDGDATLAVGAKYNTGKGFWGEGEYGQLNSDSKTDSMIEAGYYIQPNATIYLRNRTTYNGTSDKDVSTNYAIFAVNF
jgi:hypothetical protein